MEPKIAVIGGGSVNWMPTLMRDVENGELPNNVEWLGKMAQDISFNNAERRRDF